MRCPSCGTELGRSASRCAACNRLTSDVATGVLTPIPESPTVWRKDLPADLKKRVQAAFLEVKDIPWSDQGVLNGFKPTTDADYNVIRDTSKLLNLDLKKMK